MSYILSLTQIPSTLANKSTTTYIILPANQPPAAISSITSTKPPHTGQPIPTHRTIKLCNLIKHTNQNKPLFIAINHSKRTKPLQPRSRTPHNQILNHHLIINMTSNPPGYLQDKITPKLAHFA